MNHEAERAPTAQAERFTAFARTVEPKLRVALAAAMGQDAGTEATAEALAWGWEHWDRLQRMDNPAGYLYRVGRSRYPRRRGPVAMVPVPESTMPSVEPGLPDALATLTDRQRVAVVMIHGFEWTAREVADLLEVDVPTVSTHLRRGLHKLRKHLKVAPHG